MATTETAKGNIDWGDGHLVTAVDLSTIDPGATLNVSHGGVSGTEVIYVTHEVTTNSTSRDPFFLAHLRGNDSKTNNTVRLVPDTVSGGDLSGMVVRVYFHFREAAAGGIS